MGHAGFCVGFTTVGHVLVAIVIASVAADCAKPASAGGGTIGGVALHTTSAATLGVAIDIRFAAVGRVVVAVGIAFVGAGRVATDPASADLGSRADNTAAAAVQAVREFVNFATIAVFLVAIKVVVFAVDTASAIETLGDGAWFITTGSTRSAVGGI